MKYCWRRPRERVFDFNADTDRDQHHEGKPSRCREPDPRLIQADDQTERRAYLQCPDQRALCGQAVAFELAFEGGEEKAG